MMKLSTTAHKSSFVALYFLLAICISGRLCVSAHRYLSMGFPEGGGNEDRGNNNSHEEGGKKEVVATGSSLPDCSHACGACMPCKRVMVSFKCSEESCPVVYRCMCKGKYYHVPSN